MKFQITFKIPDIDEMIKTELLLTGPNFIFITSDDEKFMEAMSFVKRFVRYDELITIEFDTELKSARVISTKEL